MKSSSPRTPGWKSNSHNGRGAFDRLRSISNIALRSFLPPHVRAEARTLRTHFDSLCEPRPVTPRWKIILDCASIGCGLSETAGPSAAPDFLSRLVASRTPCGFPYRKPHTLLSLAPRTGNPGTLGMTKLRAVTFIGGPSDRMDRKKQQVPPLRFAPPAG